MLGMPDYLAFDEVDDFFGDMGRMIGQAFQMPGDQKQVDQVTDFIRMLLHGLFNPIIGCLTRASRLIFNMVCKKLGDVRDILTFIYRYVS